MSGIWGPPPEAPTDHRVKTAACGARDGDSRCDLYRNHVADFHRDSHRHTTWPIEQDTP